MKYWRNFFLTFGAAMLLAFIISIWLRRPFRWWVFVAGAFGSLIVDYWFGKWKKKHKHSAD
ncbi:hypothetical protein F9B82_01345 [Lacticaseibacillus casei]|uniref:Uncharacterized protein n=1 Tax=Lacticaseibacillus casei TaxID=1582 RepID=A0AAN1EZR6_LACCA|nr:hypothetical protein BGL52_10255 [Lacticaseibacillus casei]KAB1971162.1 hypothetical protein F9B82_01345 [Lacticaseibacillus casei]